MEEIIHVPEEQSETGNLTEYTESVVECFDSVGIGTGATPAL